jgi:hypothetical protein
VNVALADGPGRFPKSTAALAVFGGLGPRDQGEEISADAS